MKGCVVINLLILFIISIVLMSKKKDSIGTSFSAFSSSSSVSCSWTLPFSSEKNAGPGKVHCSQVHVSPTNCVLRFSQHSTQENNSCFLPLVNL